MYKRFSGGITAFFWLCAMIFVAATATAAEDQAMGRPVSARSSATASSAVSPAFPSSKSVVTTTPAVEKFEDQPLLFANNGRHLGRPNSSEGGLPSIWPVLMIVMVVCGLFTAFLFLAKKYLPGHRQFFAHPAVEILGRTHLEPKRYVTLLRVGRRIVVVGVSPDEMRPLSVITDEEEITEIMEVARPKSEMGLTIFQRLFQRQVAEQKDEETRAMAMAKAKEITEQVSSLQERVRAIRETEAPGRNIDAIG